MEPISRAEAKSKQAKIYFTGQPCKNGHVAYRYVLNGACSECVKVNNSKKGGVDLPARREAAATLVQVKLRIYADDLEVMKASAFGFASMRFPVLQMGDVYPELLPTNVAAGTGLYRFNCHVDDVHALREIAAGLVKGHTINPEEARRVAFGKAADVPMATVPDWAKEARPGDPDYK
jgi:hypothetical protein